MTMMCLYQIVQEQNTRGGDVDTQDAEKSSIKKYAVKKYAASKKQDY